MDCIPVSIRMPARGAPKGLWIAWRWSEPVEHMSNPDRTTLTKKGARRRAFNVIPAVEDVDTRRTTGWSVQPQSPRGLKRLSRKRPRSRFSRVNRSMEQQKRGIGTRSGGNKYGNGTPVKTI
jgi:hypothetical protein